MFVVADGILSISNPGPDNAMKIYLLHCLLVAFALEVGTASECRAETSERRYQNQSAQSSAPADSKPQSAFGNAGFTGTEHWVSVTGGPKPQLWYLENGLRISVGDRVVGEIVSTGFNLGKLHVAVSDEKLPFGMSAIFAPPSVRSLYVPRRLKSDSYIVCVVAGDPPDKKELLSDCSSKLVVELKCPGTAGRFSCALKSSTYIVTGPDLTLAWEKYADKPRDIRPLYLPVGPPIGFNMSPQGFPISLFVRDACDGIDNNHNGIIDEDGDRSCDDGLTCTIDRCKTTPTFSLDPGQQFSQRGGFGGPSAQCVHELTNNCQRSAKCERALCSASSPAVGPGKRVVRVDSRNQCWKILEDDWCQNVWDSCDCNGREQCRPGTAGADVQSGCAHIDRYPCDTDNDLCTVELCCEQNPHCQLGQAQDTCRALPGQMRPSRSAASGLVYCVDRTTVLGQRTWVDRNEQCDDGNSCTTNSCDPATGACRPPINRPFGAACAVTPGITGQEVTSDRCGAYSCKLDGNQSRCQLGESNLVDIRCPADTTGWLEREGFTRRGVRIRYKNPRTGRFDAQSCHLSACRSALGQRGECGITLDDSLCPPAPQNECKRYRCTRDTRKIDGGVIGCELVPDRRPEYCNLQ